VSQTFSVWNFATTYIGVADVLLMIRSLDWYLASNNFNSKGKKSFLKSRGVDSSQEEQGIYKGGS
jgi:hypothetical protein